MKTILKVLVVTYGFFTFSSLCAQEIHTQANAVSINNEANATTGWTGGTTITPDSSAPYDGSFSIKIISTSLSSNNRNAHYTFPAIVGEVYDISIWAKAGAQTDDPAFAGWSGVSGFSTTVIVGTNWVEYPFTVTATATAIEIRAYAGSSSSSVGDIVYIDKVSIMNQNAADTQAPTAATLSSPAKTDTTVDLSWSGATDNTAVTGFKVFKDGTLEATLVNAESSYQVTGLTANTAHAFTVTAFDAANNESSASNTVNATTNAASGGGYWALSGSDIAYTTGNVGIGTAAQSTYKLAVDGKIHTKEVKVDLSGWADYVFSNDYKLPSLVEVAKYIEDKGHLINIPSAEEVEVNGIELGEMNRLLLEKIEELTLYAIQQQNRQNELQERIQQQGQELITLQSLNKRMVKVEEHLLKIEKSLKSNYD